jgi:hypothetical protein
VVLGLYAVAASVAGLLTFARLPSLWSTGAAAVAWAGAFGTGLWLARPFANGWNVLGGMFAGFVFVLTTPSCVHAATLELRGVNVYSTVINVNSNESKAAKGYTYKLADPQGHEIAGHLLETGDLLSEPRRVGDHVLVVADPGGLVDPETPGQLSGRLSWIANGLSLVGTVFMALWAARSGPGVKHAPSPTDGLS